MDTRTKSDAKSEEQRELLDNVADFGWHVVGVEGEKNIPGWAYSVGFFKTFSHPEVVVFGLPADVADSMINLIGERIEGGERFEDGAEIDDLLQGVTCALRPVLEKWYAPFLGAATWFYKGIGFPAVQCIWPDHEQHYPWDRKFRRDWLWAQPLLFEESADDARVVNVLRAMKRPV